MSTHFPRPFSFKRFFVFLLVFVLATLPDLQACGPDYPTVRYSIFNHQELLDNLPQTILPFRFYDGTEAFVFDAAGSTWERGRKRNLLEWQRYLNIKGLTLTQIDNWIYQGNHAEKQIDGTKFDNKPTISLIAKNNKKAVLNYMQTVHALRNYNADAWQEGYKVIGKESDALQIKRIHDGYKNAPDAFLKQRYAYNQVILAGGYGEDDACIYFFEKHLAPFGKKSVLYWWGLDYYAAAIARKGNPAKAMYLYAQVFVNDDFKKIRMFQVFQPQYATKALTYCTTNAEKIAVLTMISQKEPGRNLKRLREMMRLSPESPLINTILTMEINKLEDWVLTKKITNNNAGTHEKCNEYAYKPEEIDGERSCYRNNLASDVLYAKSVLAWLETVSNQPKLANPALFQIATAHVAFMLNDFTKAALWAKKAENKAKLGTKINTQARLIRLLAQADFTPNADSSVTNADSLYKVLRWLSLNKKHKQGYSEVDYEEYSHSYNSQYGDCLLALASRARSQNNDVYDVLLQAKGGGFYGQRLGSRQVLDYTEYWFYDLDRRNDAALVEKLIRIATAPKTPLELYLSAPIKARINRMYDLLGTIYLRNDSLDKALIAYKNIPTKWWTHNKYELYGYLKDDPFNRFPTKINHKTFAQNKQSITEQLIAYRNKATKGDAKAMFYLANAYYNMSFHGNSWAMVRYWYTIEDNYTGEYKVLEEDLPKNKISMANYTKNNYFSADKAKFYYTKAMNLAIKQKNTKLAALCLRYVAQCENVRAHINETYSNIEQAESRKTPSAKILAQRYPQYAKQLLSGDCTGWDAFLK